MTDAHRSLIAQLFPTLRCDPFRPVGTGWTCDTYEVDDEWIVQLPRTLGAADRLRFQIGLLPELAREVSAPIPLPELVSEEPPVMGYRRIDGEPCVRGDGIWPERLGRFLYDLHTLPPELVGLRSRPSEEVRRDRRSEVEGLRDRIDPLLTPSDRAAAGAVVSAYLDDDELWRFATCITHGDLGPEHVLVTPTGDLAGVIDWEEASVGDPAWDFAWWLEEMAEPGERALAAYGGAPDSGFRRRARGAYALMPWHEVDHGLVNGEPEFVESGLEGIRRRLKAIGG